jgi:two-component system, chemotaxis family, protein-glutamate methylesterase/glutaminase
MARIGRISSTLLCGRKGDDDGGPLSFVLAEADESKMFGMPYSMNRSSSVRDVIVIGASAGGVRAVIEVLSRLPASLPAFVGVVIHRGASSTSNWSDVLGMKTELRVIEPSNGALLEHGVVYVAPADFHMRFERGRIVLDGGTKEHRTRPAVDPLFTSAALAYGDRVVAVVLTGGGHDGMQGLLQVTQAGGLSIVQNPSEAEHSSMPRYALANDHVSAALTVDEIGDALVCLARGDSVSVGDSELVGRS